jgi:hypothetical protein
LFEFGVELAADEEGVFGWWRGFVGQGSGADVLSDVVAWDDSKVCGGVWGCWVEDVGEDDVSELLGDA